jgi:hypothetical protein
LEASQEGLSFMNLMNMMNIKENFYIFIYKEALTSPVHGSVLHSDWCALAAKHIRMFQ